MRLRLSDVTGLLDTWYDPAWAEAWDAVGLVCGDPAQPVSKVLLAVDPAPRGRRRGGRVGRRPAGRAPPAVPQARARGGRDHPQGPDADDAGGGRLRAADRAHQRRPGRRRRLRGAGAARSASRDLPPIGRLRATPAGQARRSTCPARGRGPGAGGAGRRGRRRDRRLRQRAFTTPGEGRFRPLAGATPAIGEVGRARGGRRGPGRGGAARAPPRRRWSRDAGRPPLRGAGVRRRRAGRPAGRSADRRRPDRHGRAPTTLGGFAGGSSAALPATAHGVRVAGDPDRPCAGSAVCGGAGDFLLDEVLRTDADVYVTSDLRHHPAAEFLREGRAGAGRRRALGGRVDLAAGGPRRRLRGGAGAIRWRPG